MIIRLLDSIKYFLDANVNALRVVVAKLDLRAVNVFYFNAGSIRLHLFMCPYQIHITIDREMFHGSNEEFHIFILLMLSALEIILIEIS